MGGYQETTEILRKLSSIFGGRKAAFYTEYFLMIRSQRRIQRYYQALGSKDYLKSAGTLFHVSAGIRESHTLDTSKQAVVLYH